MTNRLDNITRTRLSLGTKHARTFGNTTKCFTQITTSTYKRHIELRLVNVMNIICHGQYFGFINVINLTCLQEFVLRQSVQYEPWP